MPWLKPVVVQTVFPTEDVVIASWLIQAPSEVRMPRGNHLGGHRCRGKPGGGVVFLPVGTYRCDGHLVLKEGVTLRGDRPTAGQEVQGTNPTAYAEKGSRRSSLHPPLSTGLLGFAMHRSGIQKQDPAAIVPFPWTLRSSEKRRGQLHGHERDLGESLSRPLHWPGMERASHPQERRGDSPQDGLFVDSTTDIGRVVELDFAPGWWEESGLPGAPVSDQARATLRAFLREEAMGVTMGRSDWEYLYLFCIRGYKTCFAFQKGKQGETNAAMFASDLSDCGTGLRIEVLNGIGLAATGCLLGSDEASMDWPVSIPWPSSIPASSRARPRIWFSKRGGHLYLPELRLCPQDRLVNPRAESRPFRLGVRVPRRPADRDPGGPSALRPDPGPGPGPSRASRTRARGTSSSWTEISVSKSPIAAFPPGPPRLDRPQRVSSW